jgi:hypothetical protein
MTWTQDTSTGEWTHAGTVRTGVRFAAPSGPKWQIEYRFARVADEPAILVFASEDARSGWEVGIFSDAGAANTNISIRKRVNNVPAAPAIAAAHNVPANTPFSILIEHDGTDFTATITTTGVAPVSVGPQVPTDYTTNTGHAFFSAINNARVITGGYRVAESAVSVTNSPLVGLARGNGGVYVRETNNTTWRLLATGIFAAEDQTSLVDYNGKVLLLAYTPSTRTTKYWKINIVSGTVSPWTAQYGTLPEDGRLVSSLFGRVYIASETQLYTSASPAYVNPGELPEDDWVVDLAEPGSAQVYALGTDGREGEPILAMRPSSAQGMMIFKKGSIFVLFGDPILGQPYLRTVSLECGISGRNALAAVQGKFIIHTPEGAYLVDETAALPLSKEKLRRFMDIGRNQRDVYEISVEYDPRDNVVYFFLTQKSTSPAIPRYHVVYDLASQEFLIDEYPEDFEPLSAVWWDRRILMGGRDGFFRWFAPFGDSDDGRQFKAKTTLLPIMDTPGADGAVRLSAMSLQLATEAKYRPDTQADANGVVVRVYGGSTYEDAILPNRRNLRTGPTLMSPGRQTVWCSVADHALAIEVTGQGNGFDWSVEDGTATLTPTRLGRFGGGVPRRTPGALCRPAFAGGTPTPNVPPVANAGPDINVTVADGEGAIFVTLDGTRSTDSDGTIVLYEWLNAAGVVIATGAVLDESFLVGTSTITLRVTDDDGATDTDTLTIIVNPFNPGGGGGPGGGGNTTVGGGNSTGTGGLNKNEFLVSNPGANTSSGVGEP